MQQEAAELARENWFSLCEMAEVCPDTRRTAEELAERVWRFRRRLLTAEEIQRVMGEYEATY